MKNWQKSLMGFLLMALSWAFLLADYPLIGLCFAGAALFCFSSAVHFGGNGPVKPA